MKGEEWDLVAEPPSPLPPPPPETPSLTLGVKLLSSLLKLQY